MSARILMPAGLVEQPGRQYTRDRKGLVTIRSKFQCRAADLENLIPPNGTPHPRFGYTALDEVVGVAEEGDLAVLDLVYKGQEPEADPPPVYKLQGSTREEPLRTHPRYKDFTAKEVSDVEKWVEDPESYTGPSFSGALAEYATKRKNGVESYLVPTLVWREESTSRLPTSSVSGLGKISAPAGGAPALGEGRNWLLVSAESEKQGSAYKRFREWMASGPGGWDEHLYKA